MILKLFFAVGLKYNWSDSGFDCKGGYGFESDRRAHFLICVIKISAGRLNKHRLNLDVTEQLLKYGYPVKLTFEVLSILVIQRIDVIYYEYISAKPGRNSKQTMKYLMKMVDW